jgi:PTS system mannose-specific IIC component
VSATEVALVLTLGTLAGLDLVSVPQMMISRPLAAGTLGGVVVGEPLAGLAVGALLELFALETMPIGAVRYPDWGPGAAAAGALAGEGPATGSDPALLGVVLAALGTAVLGGWSMQVLRRANVAAVERYRAALEAGSAAAVRRVQYGGLLRDALRALVLTGTALAAGRLVAGVLESAWRAPFVVARIALVASAVGVAVWSAWRLFGRGETSPWFVSGLGAGAALAILVR